MERLKDMHVHEEMEELAECMACPENVILMAALKILDDEDDGQLTEEEAKEWVAGMLDEKGQPIGETWNMETIKRVLAGAGVKADPLEMYTAMNMIQADFGEVLARHGVDEVETVIDLALAWLGDPDAKPGKLKRYMKAISK